MRIYETELKKKSYHSSNDKVKIFRENIIVIEEEQKGMLLCYCLCLFLSVPPFGLFSVFCQIPDLCANLHAFHVEFSHY